MRSNAQSPPALALTEELLRVVLADRRRVIAMDPAVAKHTLERGRLLGRFEQAQQVHTVLGHRLEAWKDDQPGRAGGLPQGVRSGHAVVVGDSENLDPLSQALGNDGLVVG